MQQPVEHKLEVIRLSLQLEHTTIKTKCYFQRRVEDSRAVFLDLKSLCLLSKGLHQCLLTGEEAQVLDLLKRCRHRSLRTQLCGAETKPFLNQDRGLVAFHSTSSTNKATRRLLGDEPRKKRIQDKNKLIYTTDVRTTSTHTSLHLANQHKKRNKFSQSQSNTWLGTDKGGG